MPEIEFSRLAQADVVKAYAWYEERQTGLGERFLESIESSLKRIKLAPDSFPVGEFNFRCVPVRQFPYLIYYRVETERIRVYAVLHASRDTEALSWRDLS